MNFFSDEMRRDPFPLYDQMRSHSPVLHVPQLDLWMIFDYQSVKRALNDHEAFSSSMFTAKRANPEWFIFFDAPRHTKFRALITRAFTPRVVANLEPRIRDLSRELLDQKIEHGEMDLAADFSVPLPMLVIAEMLGFPWRTCRGLRAGTMSCWASATPFQAARKPPTRPRNSSRRRPR
jgi:cytochrome P450